MSIQNIYHSWTDYSVSSSNCIVRQCFRVLKFLLNRVFLIYLKVKWNLFRSSCRCDGNSPIVVSLTTFPKRINSIWISIESLLNQSLRPNKIILWLSKEQFNSEETLPSKILKYKERGVYINFVDDDLRSFKKFYYVTDEDVKPNLCLVTVDDDIIYDCFLLEKLYKYHIKYPQAIICNYGHKIEYKEDGKLKSYNDWGLVNRVTEPSSDIFFGSGGGTLYPHNAFYKDLRNKNLFMKLTPFADDIWLNCMAKFQGTLICCLGTKYFMYNTFDKTTTLISYNIFHNDEQLEAVHSQYGKLFEEAYGIS